MKKKCIEKRAYGLKSKALDVARKMYLRDGTETAIYECAICLDFHLTTKRCNTKQYHKKWLTEKPKPRKKKKRQEPDQCYVIRNYERERQSKVDKIKRRVKAWYEEFLSLEKAIMARVETGQPIQRPKIKLTGTKKENTLPLSKQKEIFKLLTPHP